MGRLWLLAVVALACVQHAAPAAKARRLVAPPSPVTGRIEPLHPRAAECEPRSRLAWLGAGPDATASELEAFVKRERASPPWHRGTSGLQLSSCITEPGVCVRLVVFFCGEKRNAIDVALAERIAADPVLGARRVGVLVAFPGITGPRCESDAPGCGPMQMAGDGPRYLPGAPRWIEDDGAPDGGLECRHDQECFQHVAECLPWFRTPNSSVLVEVFTVGPRSRFCGCVEQRCSWFEQ